MDFCVKNALKLTYEYLGYQKILRGLRFLYLGEGRGSKGREKGWVGRVRKERKGEEDGQGRQGKRKGGEGREVGEGEEMGGKGMGGKGEE
jgi:hypothetical protein